MNISNLIAAKVIGPVKDRALRGIMEKKSDPRTLAERAKWLAGSDLRLSRVSEPEAAKVTVAAIQMRIRLVETGREYADLVYRLGSRARTSGARLAVFPEYSGLPLIGLIPRMKSLAMKSHSLEHAAQTAGGKNVSILDVFRFLGPYAARAYRGAFSAVARELGIYIASGSMILPAGPGGSENMVAVGYLFDPFGREIGRHCKAHLMPVEAEWGLTPGDLISVFDMDGVQVSMPICMDATYFESFRIARLKGADLVVVPSANPEPYNQWYALRGIWPRVQESQVYGIGASLVGDLLGLTFTGRSSVLAPLELTANGDGVVSQAESFDREEIVVGQVDLQALHAYRAECPLRFNPLLYQRYMPGLYRDSRARREDEAHGGQQ